MSDPYATLGRQLAAVAERLDSHRTANGRARAWLSHRRGAAAVAAVLLMAGGTAAIAATGLLSGAPVRPEVSLSPVAGNGVPVSGSAEHLLLSVPDPSGGLPWGMRVFATTRGQICAQVGRVSDGQLGELGLDSAFGNDRRFHVLRPGYGASTGQLECIAAGEPVIVEDLNADRSAMRLIPEEFRPPHEHRKVPPIRDRRALAYGLLGPHAVSVTYRTSGGLRTVPVHGPHGAFLIIEPAGYIKSFSLVGGSVEGQATASSVQVTGPDAKAMISAVAFRFGAKLCSQGTGSPIRTPCPARPVNEPQSWLTPTRSLRVPISLRLLAQSPAACKRAFLRGPCYKGELAFTAPYAITTASAEYMIQTRATCQSGGRPAGWSYNRDVRRGEVVRTDSLGLFAFTASCAAHESFQVIYQNPRGPSAAAPHESVIVGTVSMSKATRPFSPTTGSP